MRFFSASSLAIVVLLGPAMARAQDFDPRGRHHGPPHPPAHSPPRPPSTGSPGAPHPPSGAPSDAGAPPQALIERYTKIVLAQPGAPFPLQRLAQLYREKDGNLNALVADFEKRAAAGGAGPDAYASMVTLAGIYKLDGRADDAAKTYEKAIAIKASDPTALLALARLLQDRGDVAGARQRYAQALSFQTSAPDKEQTLRTMMGLALDAKDWAGAKDMHRELVKLQPASLFVKGELGRELFARSEFARAEVEFKELVAAAQGDNRALAPALKDLGKAQANAHESQDALATLKKALAAAGQESAVRAEIYETITEIYRADQKLPLLIKQLEDEHPQDFARLSLLGALYEETGDAVNARKTYQKALAINPRHIDLRLKMIRLLQSQGELDQAIAEYEGLIRSAPNNPQFVFEQADALIQRGDRARAVKLLTELEARGAQDEEVLSRLADFYGRIGENEREVKVLTRLAQVGAADPSHLVDLGDRYFQDGNAPLAVQTWKRILLTVQPRARALSALGDVYLEHDMNAEALAVLKEAAQLDPGNLSYKKQLASAYERARAYRDARALWGELADKAKKGNDRALAREARTHLVTLWGLDHMIDAQVAPLTNQFRGNPPDVEAGRTLAEVQLHLRRPADAEITLRRVIELAPGDGDGYLALERVLVQEAKLQEAILVLEKLVVVEPKRARELYQRMAQYALQIYRDDDAIKYAARAVELNPDDAEGHRRLGEMYRSRQDTEHAIVELRAALAKNDRLYVVYFELADLLLSKGETDEADRLFRRVIRGAPDDELVARAARLAMQINLGKGTLESLEQELLPLAIGSPQKPIYRRLLVEIYGNLTFALVQRARREGGSKASDADREEARAQLQRVGARAVKPLLDALADTDAGQQRVAIDVLGYVGNKNAGPALFAFATGPADAQLRARAMVACGALRDPALLPRYEGLLFPKTAGGGGAGGDEIIPSDSVAVAAAWAVARMQERAAAPALKRLAKRGTPEMRALALLGIGLLHDRTATPLVAEAARALDGGNAARAAAAYALGELGADNEAPTLVSLAEGTDTLPRELALVALARLGERAKSGGDPPGGKGALGAMADAVFAGGEGESARARATAEALGRAGSAALVMLASRDAASRVARDPLPPPDGAVDVEATLEHLVPRDLSDPERAAAVVKFGDALERAAIAGLSTSSDRARAVLESVGSGDGALAPLFTPPSPQAAGASASPVIEAARARVRAMVRAMEPAVVTLARHPDIGVRTKAVVLLARSPSDAAMDAVIRAVDDPSDAVERVALAAIGAQSSPRAVATVAKQLGAGDESGERWATRILAVQALGRLGAAGAGAEAARHLKGAALHDGYALVREAALRSLASFDPKEARELATEMAARDPEPRVRETAIAIARAR